MQDNEQEAKSNANECNYDCGSSHGAFTKDIHKRTNRFSSQVNEGDEWIDVMSCHQELPSLFVRRELVDIQSKFPYFIF